MSNEQYNWSTNLKLNAYKLPLPEYTRFMTLVNYYEDCYIYRRASLPPIDLFSAPETQLCQMEHFLPTWQSILGYQL